MSRDIIADVMNQIMNAKRAKKSYIEVSRSSKLLLNILEMMKKYGLVEYEILDGRIKVVIKEINECSVIKPRYSVNKKNMEKYIRRFLPARNFGYVVISTSKGLLTHNEAQENNIGGSLIAYFY
jgi:ribosomal protein S8